MPGAGLVLCGGFSRRMGRDKGSLLLGEKTLLEHTAAALASVFPEILLVARSGQVLETRSLSLPVVRDPAEGLGPLAGLVAGLEATTADLVFVASCDQPFLDGATIRALLEAADRQITVPRIDGRLMMTTAIYRRSVLPAARALLGQHRLRPAFLLESCTARVLDGLDAAPFRDIDSPEDYARELRAGGYTPASA